jgi:hypothetical protein
MIDSGGKPLASEIELCSNDFVRVVRRHRPLWQRRRTDMKTVNYYHHFWTQGIWELAVTDSAAASRRAGVDQLAPEMVKNQRANRRAFLDAKFEGSYNDFKHYCERDAPVFGMRQGDVIDQWRLDIGLYYWRHLAPQFQHATDPTMRDWCGAYLELGRVTLNSSDFGQLWLNDIGVTDIKRDWLQSAVRWSQTHRKITPSNPVDEQHSAYLLDAEAFITADGRLVDVLRDVQSHAPFAFAEPILINREAPGDFIDSLLAALN